MIDELAQDLAYVMRALRSETGFALVALLTLALGIGATPDRSPASGPCAPN